jgi:aryl-alcohol dehydrogenase-like predicted oxidoreductase
MTRILGATGLRVSRIGLGMAALGRPGYINIGHAADLAQQYDQTAMEQRAWTVLDAAWETGIRYFDVARSYGLGEQFLSTWLNNRGLSPEDLTVGSKWGYTYTAEWRADAPVHEVKNHSLEVLRKQWVKSHQLLGSYLKLYQIHSATLESAVLENSKVLDELARLKTLGLHVGLTLSGPQQSDAIRLALDIRRDGVHLFEAVQATWNLLEQSAGRVLAEAHSAGLGVVIKEALANGRLTERNEREASESFMKQLRAEAERLNVSPDALAIAACLAQPFADVVLSGAATVKHLQMNMKAQEIALDDRALARLSACSASTESYWAARKDLAWN